MKRIAYYFLGVVGLLAILSSIAVTGVTNESLMLQGFQRFAQISHLNVPYQRYGDYARALSRYLDGKAAAVQVKNPETGEMENAFSDRENRHLQDVRGIVTALKIMRYAGGGLVIAVLASLYCLRKEQRPQLLNNAARGFALASLTLLLIAAALAVWGLTNFRGLFWTFHQIAFSNDLWLLDPSTDLLVALMPEAFFSWYTVEMLKSLWPILGMMALIVFVWLRLGKTQKETTKP